MQNIAQHSGRRTAGMTSANALVLGDARWGLARPICGNFKQFPTPQQNPALKPSPHPPQRG